MISVDYRMNALEHFKVRLPFFYTPCIKRRRGRRYGHFSNFIQNARTKIQSDLPPFIILSLKEQKLLDRISSSVGKNDVVRFLV